MLPIGHGLTSLKQTRIFKNRTQGIAFTGLQLEFKTITNKNICPWERSHKENLKMDKLLTLLENDATLTAEELALMLKKEVGEIKDIIQKYERDGVILGYQTVVDWDKTDREYVSALIEVKVTPQRDRGFDKIAEKITLHPEVKSLYLMSGGFDFTVLIEGKTMKEVAYFVAQKLAPIEFVTSTATHFVLRKYKDKGVIYSAPVVDERGNMPL